MIDTTNNKPAVRASDIRLTPASDEQPLPTILQPQTPLDPRSFPDQPRSGDRVPTTLANVRHLLIRWGITCRYNVIAKKTEILIPGCEGDPDNADNANLAFITSLAVLHGLRTDLIAEFVEAIANPTLFNPVAEWITSKAWDGIDRLQALFDTLTVGPDFPVELKQALLFRWLLSCVAAVLLPEGFRCRGVLVLQGAQGLGKTQWIGNLVDIPILRNSLVRLGHHLDPHDKDSVLTAISNWIVELGELDSTFKKDIATLKGFLSNTFDRHRRPYGKRDSTYPRKTVFAASVNEANFLVDDTGNTRFWVLPVIKIDYEHGIDMQQVFAQLRVELDKGTQWWLTQEEEQQLEELNKQHRTVSAIRERVFEAIDRDRIGADNLPAMTASQVLEVLGIQHPSNQQAREAGAALREVLGPPTKTGGRDKWKVPLDPREHFVPE